MTRLVPALSGAGTAALVALAAMAGHAPLTAALLLVTVLVATGWAALLGLPSPRGSTAVIAVAGAGAVAAVALTTDPPYLRWLPVVLALGVLLELAHQLFRRDMRPRLVESVTGVLLGLVVVGLAAGWAGAVRLPAGGELVLAGGVAALAASAATGLPWPQRLTGPSGVLAAAAFAALAGRLLPEPPAPVAALLGAAVGVVVVAMDRLLAILPTGRRLQAGVARGAAPVAASGLVAYALGRLVA